MSFNLADVLSDVSKLDANREQIEYIKLDLIDADPNNFYQLSGVEDLAANIQLCGLQQPIRLRKHPTETGRYMIVSGHRRREAILLLAKDDPDKWEEIPCIIQREEVSSTLQQLQLIFANASTRKLTEAELSEQAVQVEKLLYQLKEEEGYEFPGRMRDYVAEIVGASKTKLARMKVIREKLAKCWRPQWKKGVLNESVAYELAQLPEVWQMVIHSVRAGRYLDAKYVKIFKKRFEQINDLKCETMPGYGHCHNIDKKRLHAVDDAYGSFYCAKCCSECPALISCKEACPVMRDKVAKLKSDKREARKQEIAAEREAERPKVQQVESIWHRFGLERSRSGCSVKDVKDAMGAYCFSDDAQKYGAFESGAKRVTSGTKLPFGMYLYDVTKLTAVADLFKCSVDYLLCRTDVKEMAQPAQEVFETGAGWQNGDPAEPGQYVLLLQYCAGGDMFPKRWTWNGYAWEIAGIIFDPEIDGKLIGWMKVPKEE